ncbi:hypothetical protein N9I19_01560 [Peribacillus sp. CSMR9]|nr:hypothetical protein [Peribacillus sp. CSMR9]
MKIISSLEARKGEIITSFFLKPVMITVKNAKKGPPPTFACYILTQGVIIIGETLL